MGATGVLGLIRLWVWPESDAVERGMGLNSGCEKDEWALKRFGFVRKGMMSLKLEGSKSRSLERTGNAA